MTEKHNEYMFFSIIWLWSKSALRIDVAYTFNSTYCNISIYCIHCLFSSVAAKDSSTANLFQHLKKKHSHEQDQCVALWASQDNDDESL